MTEQEIRDRVATMPGWRLAEGGLRKEYKFPDFGGAMRFMAAAAAGIETLNHHPEWTNVYNRVSVHLTTHDAGGVTAKDFELAGVLDAAARKHS